MNINIRTNNHIDNISFFITKKENADDLYLFINKDNDKVLFELEPDLENKTFKIISQTVEVNKEELDYILSNAFTKIIELEQSGIENYDDISEKEENPYNPEKIKLRTDKISIVQISAMIDSGDIDLTPAFQRNLVWDSFQKSRLIESILLRIPLPMFYFAEDLEGKLTVIDGLQRISTIKEFMNNQFPLKQLQYLKNCEGLYFKDEGDK